MPKFLHDKLAREAAAKGKTGRAADRYVYGAMNNMGAMHGNKETAKGARMEAKHERDVGAPPATGLRERRIAAHVNPDRTDAVRSRSSDNGYERHTMQRHGQMVREAHDHLSKAMPSYGRLSKRQRGVAIQEHIRARRGM